MKRRGSKRMVDMQKVVMVVVGALLLGWVASQLNSTGWANKLTDFVSKEAKTVAHGAKKAVHDKAVRDADARECKKLKSACEATAKSHAHNVGKQEYKKKMGQCYAPHVGTHTRYKCTWG
tara:strand:- start:106 stop:465 length:360 start_codon:yes stop_codon:yes gene_type:complete